MANKPTKKALLLSALSMILCLAMLVGTTFAWFTDSVASGRNTIKAGNLDVELKYLKNGAWTDVQGATDLFDPNALWEPGHAEVVYLQIKNAGTLDLKYQFSMNIISETVATNVLGDSFTLSQHLMYGVTDYTAAYATREEAIAAVKANESKFADYSMVGQLLDGEVKEIALVVYMPTTVGNEANYRGDVVPSIDFGLNLVATQLVSEEDFFGNTYDEDASLLPTWDGTATAADELTKDANGVYQIGSAEDLAGFAALVNGGTANVSAVLTADIDLGNKPWTPIGVSGAPFNGTFDGNGYTIYNLNVSGTASVGFIGNAGNSASIYNVKIDGATVSGNHYVGTVLGYGYLSANSLAGCTVQNATVVCTPDANNDNGDKAGVIAGMAINGNIYNNKAINSTVYAYRDFGGIVGCAQAENRNISVYGNVVENVTLTYITCENYADTTKTNSNRNNHVGRVSEHASFKVTIGDNNGAATMTENKAAHADTNDKLSEALKNDATVVISAGEYTLPTMNGKEGITIIGAADGSTVIGGENAYAGFSSSNFGKDTTVKNIEFSGTTNGVRDSYANGGDLVFDNCTFKGGSTYGFHMDQSNGATLTFNNCTFVGFNAFAGDLVKVTFNNCTFLSNGNYGHTNIHSVGEFNNCTWGDSTSVSPAKAAAKLFFNGVEESYHHEYIGSAESLVAFQKSVNEGGDSWNGQKVLLVADIDLKNAAWTPIGQTCAAEFRGIFDGQGHTIKNLNIDSSAQTGGNYSSGLFGWAEAGVTIKNVNVDGATVVGNHNVAVIVGYTYSAKISNCHVTNANITCTHANGDACGDKCGLIGGYVGDEARISNCSASNSTVKAGRDAGQLIGAGYNVSVSGCSADNVTVTATGDCNREGNINNAIIGRVLG